MSALNGYIRAAAKVKAKGGGREARAQKKAMSKSKRVRIGRAKKG